MVNPLRLKSARFEYEFLMRGQSLLSLLQLYLRTVCEKAIRPTCVLLKAPVTLDERGLSIALKHVSSPMLLQLTWLIRFDHVKSLFGTS